MRIRTTEKPHAFSEEIDKSIPIYELQGLTLDSSKNFSAGIEAVEFDIEEDLILKEIFLKNQWVAKICLCNALSIPLYLITYKEGDNFIFTYKLNLYKNEEGYDLQVFRHKSMKLDKFSDWWGKLKGTKQTKKLYEAAPRARNIFDITLFRNNLAWGGNVDGYILNSDLDPQAIIETRYTSKNPLERYDPAIFFLPIFQGQETIIHRNLYCSLLN